MLRRLTSLLFLFVGSLSPGSAALAVEEPVLVFGGTSGTGLATVKNLRAQGIQVTVFVRPTSDLSGLEPLGINTVVGDALNAGDVNRAFSTARFRTVVSSLGGSRGEPRPDYIGNRNITESALATGVRRVLQVSSIGAGESREPVNADEDYMGNVMYNKTLGEDALINSGLDYTIIRPGGLLRGPATNTGILSEAELTTGLIDREELGRLIVQALDEPDTVGKILYAVDPERERTEQD